MSLNVFQKYALATHRFKRHLQLHSNFLDNMAVTKEIAVQYYYYCIFCLDAFNIKTNTSQFGFIAPEFFLFAYFYFITLEMSIIFCIIYLSILKQKDATKLHMYSKYSIMTWNMVKKQLYYFQYIRNTTHILYWYWPGYNIKVFDAQRI